MFLALATIIGAMIINPPLVVTHNPVPEGVHATTEVIQPADTKNAYHLTVTTQALQPTVSGQSLQGSSPNLQPAHNPVQ